MWMKSQAIQAGKTPEPKPSDFRDCCATADRRQRALVDVTKRLRRLTPNRMHYIARGVPSYFRLPTGDLDLGHFPKLSHSLNRVTASAGICEIRPQLFVRKATEYREDLSCRLPQLQVLRFSGHVAPVLKAGVQTPRTVLAGFRAAAMPPQTAPQGSSVRLVAVCVNVAG
jgi:hypothetical protein